LFLPRSFLPLVLGGAPRNDEAVTAANDNMLHSRAAARGGMVAQLQFQMTHVVYEIRVTMSTKISAGRGALPVFRHGGGAGLAWAPVSC
jgi:hypothetical protein